MKITYTGNYVDEKHDVVICFTASVGGGPKRFLTCKVPARSLDTEEVHNAMAYAALALLGPQTAPPWEVDTLPLW